MVSDIVGHEPLKGAQVHRAVDTMKMGSTDRGRQREREREREINACTYIHMHVYPHI